MAPRLVVGLTGGIASGKSTVAEALRTQPAVHVLSGDALGHEAYAPGTPAYHRLIEVFGPGVVDEGSTARPINRRALGAIVFADPARLSELNAIVWPAIRALALERIAAQPADVRVVVFEAAVLVEAGWQDMCDEVWSVAVPEEVAVARLQTRNGLAPEDALKRIRSQLSNDERERVATRRLRNNGSLEQLREAVAAAWAAFCRDHGVPHAMCAWEYLAEGNASVVLRYVGEPVPVQAPEPLVDGQADLDHTWVLRISKRPLDLAAAECYRREVIAPLLGLQYFAETRCVQLDAHGLERLALQIDTQRPAQRRRPGAVASQLFAGQREGLLTRSCALLHAGPHAQPSTVAVEIKPKTGFVTQSPFVDRRHVIKHEFCRYCMHRQLRVRYEGQAARATRYCPIDLFSGQPGRVQHALACLLSEPANNLRLFADGRVVDGVASLAPLRGFAAPADALACIVTAVLLHEPLLPSLRHHQASLDAWDIEFVHRVYAHLVGAGVDVTHALREFDATMYRVTPATPARPGATPDEALHGMSRAEQLLVLRDFLVAATLKDCSLFVALSLEPGPPPERSLSVAVEADREPVLVWYQVSVVDVDRKDVHKIPEYHELDRRIAEAFDASAHDRGPCVAPV